MRWRDMEKRGRTFESVRDQYYATVRPMHLQFVEPSKRWADVIIPEGGNNTVALDLVVAKIRAVLAYTALEATATGTVEQRPASSLVLFDRDGKVIWKAP